MLSTRAAAVKRPDRGSVDDPDRAQLRDGMKELHTADVSADSTGRGAKGNLGPRLTTACAIQLPAASPANSTMFHLRTIGVSLPARLAAIAALTASAVLSLGSGATPPARPAQGEAPSKAESERASLLLRSPKPGPAGFIGDPYPLDYCIVDGAKLGPDAVTVVLKDVAASQEGRQLKFCCAKCEAAFKERMGELTRKLDDAIAAAQAPSYPVNHCLVMIEEKLGKDYQTVVYGNRAYHFCCSKCVNNFKKNTGRYVGVLDKELTTKQKSKYPLTTCVVTDAPLPEKPYDVVIGYTLFRVADEAAAKKLLLDPAPYAAKLEAAAKKAEAGGSKTGGSTEKH